jgi:glycosyltransferase involved in cell wall biosynthesis
MDELKRLDIKPKIHIIRFRPYFYYVLNMNSLIIKEKPDIVHGNFVPIYFPVNLISIFTKTRFIYTHHGPYLEKISKLKKLIMFSLARIFDIGIKKIVFVSDYLLKKHIEYNAPIKDNLIRIYNGTDIGRYSLKFDKAGFRKRLGIKEHESVLTCVSHLMDFKGIQYLVDALPKVIKFNGTIKLLIIGEGPYKHELEKIIRQKNLDEHVIFLGNRNDVNKIIMVSDIVLMPSITGEGLPYTIIEYMAGGKPIIATNVGGVPEEIEHMKTGILIPPRSSIEISKNIIYLIKNKRTAARLGKNARKSAFIKFNVERVAEDYLKLYEKAF